MPQLKIAVFELVLKRKLVEINARFFVGYGNGPKAMQRGQVGEAQQPTPVKPGPGLPGFHPPPPRLHTAAKTNQISQCT